VLKLAFDENINEHIVMGIRRRHPEIDLVLVREVGLNATDDRVILQWAADEQRLMITADVETMENFAYERVRAGLSMPGLVQISRASVAQAIDDIILLAIASEDGEYEGQVRYLPL
jgi:predicted nuclease of predicted toxin-antitoxin system